MDDNSNSSPRSCNNDNEIDIESDNDNMRCSLLIPEYDVWDDELYNGTIDRALLHDIKYNKNTVSTIDLYYNRIGQDGVVLLAHALQSNTLVTELNLSGCFIHDSGLDILLDGIVRRQNHACSNIQVLKLNNNGITHVGATKIATSLLLQPEYNNNNRRRSPPSITVLHLNSNELRDKGAKILATSLLQNMTLWELTLCNNKMGNDGAIAFGQLLVLQKSLRQLYLSDNFISTAGFHSILTAVQRNTKLKELHMERNWNTQQEDLSVRIADVLKYNTSLTHLYLSSHNDNDNIYDNKYERIIWETMQDWNDTLQYMTFGGGCCFVDCTTATFTRLGRLLYENRMGLRRAPKKMERQRHIWIHDLKTYWIPSPYFRESFG